MSIEENRHYKEVKDKKKHPASKCRNAKCMICHPNKVAKFDKPKYKFKKEDYDINDYL